MDFIILVRVLIEKLREICKYAIDACQYDGKNFNFFNYIFVKP